MPEFTVIHSGPCSIRMPLCYAPQAPVPFCIIPRITLCPDTSLSCTSAALDPTPTPTPTIVHHYVGPGAGGGTPPAIIPSNTFCCAFIRSCRWHCISISWISASMVLCTLLLGATC
jgi:hypothetical protein